MTFHHLLVYFKNSIQLIFRIRYNVAEGIQRYNTQQNVIGLHKNNENSERYREVKHEIVKKS